MTIINISRRELYDKVWSMPLQKVADALDCDYWRLRSACIDACIPVPPKGYWMKVAHGKILPEQPALPEHPRSYNSVPLHVGEAAEKSRIAARRDLALSLGAMKIPARLSNPHPAVIEIMSERGRWASNSQLYEILSAPPTECTRRGFRFSDVIAKAAEKHGFRVSTERNGELVISSSYRNTRVRVWEKLRQIRILLPGASHPKKGESTRGRYGYDLRPTGLLEIQLSGGKWVEEPKDDLEANLPRLLARLLSDREHDKEAAASAAERARIREIEARKRARAKWIANQQALAFTEFLDMSSRWTAASQARAFLTAIRTAGHGESTDAVFQWLDHEIDALDPLRAGADRVIEKLSAVRDDLGEYKDEE